MHYLPLRSHSGDTVLPDGHVMRGARLKDVVLHTQDNTSVKPKGSHRLYAALANSDLPLSLVGNEQLRRRLETLREPSSGKKEEEEKEEEPQHPRRPQRRRKPWIHLQ